MKATELMIGDWLCNNNIIIGQKEFQVYPYFIPQCKGNELEDLNIKPIPLTSEILELNDWYFGLTSNEEDMESCFRVPSGIQKHWTYDEGAGEVSLSFPNESDGGILVLDDQNNNRHLEFIWCDTVFVHELQHALRLCGLNELADNWRIQ